MDGWVGSRWVAGGWVGGSVTGKELGGGLPVYRYDIWLLYSCVLRGSRSFRAGAWGVGGVVGGWGEGGVKWLDGCVKKFEVWERGHYLAGMATVGVGLRNLSGSPWQLAAQGRAISRMACWVSGRLPASCDACT